MPEPFNFLGNLSDKEVSQKEKEFYGSHKNLKLTETPFKTQYGRKVYKDQYGQKHSESSVTIQDSKGRWMNVPTIFNGEYVNEKLARDIIEDNKYIDPENNKKIKTFETLKDAEEEAVKRNRSLNKSDQSWNEDNTGLNKRETVSVNCFSFINVILLFRPSSIISIKYVSGFSISASSMASLSFPVTIS